MNAMTAVTIIYIALKLYGVLDWSWYWIFSPIWLYLSYCLVVTVIAVIVGAIWGLLI